MIALIIHIAMGIGFLIVLGLIIDLIWKFIKLFID